MGSCRLTYEDMMSHPEVWGKELPKWATELAEKGYKGVCAVDFYSDIFGDDLEEERLPDDYKRGEYAGIAIEKVKKTDDKGNLVLDNKNRPRYIGRRYTITKGNMKLYNLIDSSDNFCMIAPISYAGRVRKNDNARYMYALCIEVDHIKPKTGLQELIYSWVRDFLAVPEPTYIVCSGAGLHLYFVFERPIPLWRNVFEQLTEVKKYFTPILWSQYISLASDAIQYESINQPFRCVGTRTKAGSYALAFKVGKKITIEQLNSFLPKELKLNCVYKSKHTLDEAKRLYPEWYQRRIEQGQERGCYNRHKPIYYNWIDKILKGAVVGKRYNCLENLCSLAVQCNIEPEQVEADCRRIAEHFERLTNSEDNHFTEYDVLCALKTYHTASEQAYRRKIEYIAKKTGIPLTPNKRNGRKQIVHLMGARALQQINDQVNGTNWREGNGRPKESGTKAQQVFDYRVAHPDAKKIDCERETKLSRHTVLKWWNWQPEHEKTVDEMTDEEYEQLFYHEMDMDIMFDIRQNGRWSESDEEELTAFKANRKALVSPLKRIEMRNAGFKVSQEAEYDAMREELEREIEKTIWSGARREML
ncbi:hypothetical protein [Phascolarctobacterium succinatutens]|uniref:hypothetical protein n=1 Tax=Phascolarctobacterium succinatutens TaxID=626940 RepID=UPI003AAC9B2D